MDLISVIVPVYNVEKYLDRCVESIVNQTYTNLEIILVDDGSPDECPVMCDKWQEKDQRITVIHTTNGGSARARNLALRAAHGEYISFCDSDDMMRPDMLEKLHTVALEEDADIVECDYSTCEADIFDYHNDCAAVRTCDPICALKYNLHGSVFSQVIWNKIYKSSIVVGVFFVEQKIIDDEFWTYRAIGNATKLARIDEKMYFYRQQNSSIMHQSYSLKRLAAVEAHVERHEYLKEKYPELVKQSLIRIWFDCRYHGQMASKYLSVDDKHECFAYLNSILKKYPLTRSYVSDQPLKEKIWMLLEKRSLPLVCAVRNILNIGF